jgi:D-alanyl-D-alanine carboxypeptidase
LKPEELLSYILGEPASFKAGDDWEYSDTNYILLGMIIEQVTGKKYYDLLKTRILAVYQLQNTIPSDHRKLDSLSQGYAGEENDFGRKDKVVSDDGNFVVNPQFEWTGGGIYSTTDDLAKWGKLQYEGKAFDSVLLPVMLQGVPAKLVKTCSMGLASSSAILRWERPMATVDSFQGI